MIDISALETAAAEETDRHTRGIEGQQTPRSQTQSWTAEGAGSCSNKKRHMYNQDRSAPYAIRKGTFDHLPVQRDHAEHTVSLQSKDYIAFSKDAAMA